MRVVLDTNVFVSALVFPGGNASVALDRVLDGRDALVLSKPIIDETIGILARKFGRHAEELARTALFLTDIAELIAPDVELAVFTDEPDNRVLECAVAGGASAIVTGDKAMIAPGEHEGIEIVSLAEHVSRIP